MGKTEHLCPICHQQDVALADKGENTMSPSAAGADSGHQAALEKVQFCIIRFASGVLI